jgi:spore maturation protein CgeB
MPINPLFFAIPGCGTCQIAENKTYLRQWLTPGREYVPFEDSTFIKTLVHYANNPVECDWIQSNGYEAVLGHHTFRARVREIIATIMKLEQ